MQVLGGSTVGDELASQPIQEAGMGRSAARASEVAGCVHQAGPKMSLPNPVHHNPSDQGLIGLGQPLGQSVSPLGLRRVGWQAHGSQDLRHRWSHLGPGLFGVPSVQQVDAVGFAEDSGKGLLRGHGSGNGAFEPEAFVQQSLGLLAGPRI